jgi:uncharacterized protein YfaS (alpha-2-macroglobulin family)
MEIIPDNTLLTTGEKITVTLTFESPRLLRYVFIEDKRAAAFEPADNSSGNEYQDGIDFYKSIRDAGMQFFANRITAGRHQIRYEVVVSREGTYYNGFASMQCMYNPAIKVFSGIQSIRVAE